MVHQGRKAETHKAADPTTTTTLKLLAARVGSLGPPMGRLSAHSATCLRKGPVRRLRTSPRLRAKTPGSCLARPAPVRDSGDGPGGRSPAPTVRGGGIGHLEEGWAPDAAEARRLLPRRRPPERRCADPGRQVTRGYPFALPEAHTGLADGGESSARCGGQRRRASPVKRGRGRNDRAHRGWPTRWPVRRCHGTTAHGGGHAPDVRPLSSSPLPPVRNPGRIPG